jgi:predicted  nucleic acid-binding Zn-ribbon protein
MDRDSLLFEDKYNPGDYIRYLKSEVEYVLDELRDAKDELDEVRDELKGLKTMTVVNLISELKDKISDMDLKVRYAEFEREKAYKEVEETRAKMKVWRAISTEL